MGCFTLAVARPIEGLRSSYELEGDGSRERDLGVDAWVPCRTDEEKRIGVSGRQALWVLYDGGYGMEMAQKDRWRLTLEEIVQYFAAIACFGKGKTQLTGRLFSDWMGSVMEGPWEAWKLMPPCHHPAKSDASEEVGWFPS